jgi:omega-amidase
MKYLKVALVQTDLFWEDKTANLANLEEKLAGLKGNPDLILLPEMFNTGFSMDTAKLAEPMNFITFKWMAQMAKKHNAVLVGSLIINENGHNYNRIIWMEPSGSFDTYDKRHLFQMGGEGNQFAAGTKKIIKQLKGFNICPLICYDLRFPVWSRNRNCEYDVLIYLANWPKPRAEVWSNLLVARAIENQCYSIGVNRVGIDGAGLEYTGGSAIINYKGQTLASEHDNEAILLYEINKEELDEFRTKFPAYLDADNFEII